MDKGKAKNYNNRNNDSGDIDNDNAKDSDSSNNNRAHRCIGQWGSLNPISSQLKLKLPIKYLSMDPSN